MPYGFKNEVPRYPNALIVRTMSLKDGYYAQLETPDSGNQVLGYYKDSMARSGWTVRVEREAVPSADKNTIYGTFLALFKDNTGVMIDTSTPPGGGKTLIELFMGDVDG
jgi:hypothetical protein